MAMAASSLSSYGGQNVMMLRGDMGSSNSLVTMLTSCNPHVNFPVVGGGGGLEDAIVGMKRPYSYSTFDSTPLLDRDPDDDAGDDVLSGGGGGQGGGPVEKKRRLSFDQVRSLERNFEMENKLEPERKMQLAKELGLQPRQVAVWFQNRRARWKTKQLERDYEMLNSGYLKLKTDFETALREKDVLKAEVQRLSGKTSSQDSQQSVDSSQCESESPSSPLSRKGVDLIVKEKLLVEELVIDPQSTTSSGSHSSELLDAESPRTADSNPLPQLAGYCSQLNNTTTLSAADTFTVGPGHDDVGAAVKLEDHGFPVDPSCGYFLPPISDQSVLPWWDWA